MNDIALHEIDGAPRALDTDIGERLGMKRPTNIRGLIEANMAELAEFGDVARAECNVSMPNGGTKTVTEYHLNEEQALTIAQISRAPRAKEVRAMLVRVFVAYRRGLLTTDAELARRLDGMVKMVAHKVTGTEKMVALVSEALTRQDSRTEQLETAVIELAQRVNHLMLSADPRVAALELVSVRELLNEAGALQKGRNSLNRKIGRALRDRALLRQSPLAVRKCPHSGVWLFPRDFAAAFMAERGNSMVADHNDRVMGQGVIKFPHRKPAKSHQQGGEARP